MKQKFYRLDNIDKLQADYNILLGERSNGKSYAVKERAIMQAWKDPMQHKFILLRRWELEIKQSLAEQYFLDAPITSITDGQADGVTVYRGEIWLSKKSDDGKTVRTVKIGYTRALSQEQHYTSGAYDDVDCVIYEEFISRTYYLPGEPLHLMQLVSTVARRRKITVYMIGNTISRLCPYFSEWQLVGIPKQQQGTIETYKYQTDQIDDAGQPVSVLIAVEFCENSGKNSKMFFGSSTKMITTGAWQSKEMPHLPKPARPAYYDTVYQVFMHCANFCFRLSLLSDKENGSLQWYVEPSAGDAPHPDDRVITDQLGSVGIMTTIGVKPLNQREQYAFSLLTGGQVCYCDNLTGSDFTVCLKQIMALDTLAD